jgi:hypothetical protein
MNMEKSINSIKMDSPQVGKYFHANLIYSKWEKTWYCGLCYCTGVYNENDKEFLTVQTQCGTKYEITPDKIIDEVIANPQPKYSIGQNVLATIAYHMNQEINDYCRIESIITFCNHISYNVVIISENKKIIVHESSIHKIATLKTPIYQIGLRVGVKIYHNTGYVYNDNYTIKNGVITNIIQTFDYVAYDVTLDDNTVEKKIFESYIDEPYTPPSQVDIKVMLKTREQELLVELEQIRAMMLE